MGYKPDTILASMRRLGAPRANEDDTILAAVRGRVLNRPRLAALLGERGHVLAGEADAELLAHLYEEFGAALVYALDGMFALAVWDRRVDQVLLARDRFGEETLFYAEQDGSLGFGPDPRELAGAGAGRLDPAVVSDYLQRGHVPPDRSILSTVSQLAPGSTLSWRPGGAPEAVRYWRLPEASDPGGESREEVLAELGRLLGRSVRLRLDDDPRPRVILGTGRGGAALAAVAAREAAVPLRTVAAGLDREAAAAAASLAAEIGAEHQELVVDVDGLAAAALAALSRASHPQGDPAALPLPVLAQAGAGMDGVALGAAGVGELGDPNSTQAALALRSPFLDYQLAEFTVTLPPALRGEGDGLLAALAGRRSLPAGLERTVALPVAGWLRGALAPTLEAELEQGPAVAGGWVDAASIGDACRRHLRGSDDRSTELWRALVLSRWLAAPEGENDGG